MTFYLAVIGDNPTSQEICRQATPLHGYKLVELVESGSGRLHIKGEPAHRLHAIVVTQDVPDSSAQALIIKARDMGASFVMGVETLTPFTQQSIEQASPWATHVPCAASDFLNLRDSWLPNAIEQARSNLIQSVEILTVTSGLRNAPASMAQLLDKAGQACGDLIIPNAMWAQEAKACPQGTQRHTVTVRSHMGELLTTSITTDLKEHAKGLLAIARQMPNDPKRNFPLSYKLGL